MKVALLCFALAVALYACGRNDPSAQRAPGAKVDEAQLAEKAADAGKPLNETSLTAIVRAALQSESSLDSRKIDVENRGGNVTLHGTVESDDQREKAARIVGSVGGVRTVDNKLTVDPSASTGTTARRPD